MTQTRIHRRLRPLLIANFLQEVIFWYAVEKIFMSSIGFTSTTIGVSVVVVTLAKLLVETPSGILADRWSRKGMLVIASFAIVASSLVCGLSNNVGFYLIGSALWGGYYALRSGIFASIVYDLLLEETGKTEGYEKHVGKVQAVNSAALVIGNLLGGIAASGWGLRAPFLLTIPFGLMAIFFLLRFKEPKLHLAEPHASLSQHAKETLSAVLKRGSLRWVVATLILLDIGIVLLFEYSQLWYIALSFPIIVLGPIWALLNAAVGLGGLAAPFVRRKTWGATTLALILVLWALALMTRIGPLIVAAQFSLLGGFFVLSIILSHTLHNNLPSRIRAGGAAAVATLAQLVGIPLALAFGLLSDYASVFTAAWILIGIAGLILFTFAKIKSEASAGPPHVPMALPDKSRAV